MQKKTKAKKIKTEDFLSADNIDHKPLIRSKMQLSPKAVSRILRITRIPVTESIQKLACQHLIESGLANEFETYRNGMIHEKSPAQTKKDLEKCIKSIKIIHKITTREKMDESLSSDFLMA